VKRLLFVLCAVLIFAGAACGDDDDGGGGGGTLTAENGKVTLVAKDIKWQSDRIEVPAGEPVTITVDNEDAGTAHNLHIKDVPGGALKTDVESGKTTQTLDVDIDKAGDYSYVCDVHPDMKGTLVVK
jgi:plastocyanin